MKGPAIRIFIKTFIRYFDAWKIKQNKSFREISKLKLNIYESKIGNRGLGKF